MKKKTGMHMCFRCYFCNTYAKVDMQTRCHGDCIRVLVHLLLFFHPNFNFIHCFHSEIYICATLLFSRSCFVNKI